MSVCAIQRYQKQTPATRVYQRRRPERTATYQAVQHHLETWLSNTRESNPDYDPIPQHVERDLRKFLECGILAHVFAYMDVGTEREQERKLCSCSLR